MSAKIRLDHAHLHHLLRQMIRVRHFEAKCVELYQAQKILGFPRHDQPGRRPPRERWSHRRAAVERDRSAVAETREAMTGTEAKDLIFEVLRDI
jgi:hypothetical protein